MGEDGKLRIDPLHDVKTVAIFFGVHENTVYELVSNGNLKAFRVGKRVIRIPETSVRKYLDAQKIDFSELE